MAGKSSCSPTPLTSLPLLTDGDGTAVYTGAPGCGYGYSYPYYGGYSYPYYDYYPYGGKGLCMSIVLYVSIIASGEAPASMRIVFRALAKNCISSCRVEIHKGACIWWATSSFHPSLLPLTPEGGSNLVTNLFNVLVLVAGAGYYAYPGYSYPGYGYSYSYPSTVVSFY